MAVKKTAEVEEDPQPPKKRRGRPPNPIDWKLFEQLCYIQCTHEEIGNTLKISRKQLIERAEKKYEENFPTIYKRFSDGGKASLRRIQFQLAKKNAGMAIWLGKVYLGQREPPPDDPHVERQSQFVKAVMDYAGSEKGDLVAKIERLESELRKLKSEGK